MRSMKIASLILSIVAIFVSGFAAYGSLVGDAANATAQLSATCLEWVKYVRSEQANPRNSDVPPAALDERIDRVGVVLYSRLGALGSSVSSGEVNAWLGSA